MKVKRSRKDIYIFKDSTGIICENSKASRWELNLLAKVMATAFVDQLVQRWSRDPCRGRGFNSQPDALLFQFSQLVPVES